MKRLFLAAVLCVCAHAQGITWSKRWTAPNTGSSGTYFNGYEDIHYDPYTGKTWLYTTSTTNTGQGIYSSRLHYFDSTTFTDTTVGDNGQTTTSGCLASRADWPWSHHVVSQWAVDTIRHRLLIAEGTSCAAIGPEQWYYQLTNPVDGHASWTQQEPPHLPMSASQNTTWRKTALSVSIAAGDTTLSLLNPGGFANNSFIKIDSEIIKITGNGGTWGYTGSAGTAGQNPFTVQRGAYGTTPAPHANGATVSGLEGQFNAGALIFDPTDDVFVMFGAPNSGNGVQLQVYCDASLNGNELTATQIAAGCTAANDWTNISGKSICADVTNCVAVTTGTNGANSGRVPKGFYYPNMEWDPVHHRILSWGGSYGVNTRQYVLWAYDISMKTWTNLNPTCSDPACVNGQPPFQSTNSENYRMMHALDSSTGKLYYHLTLRPSTSGAYTSSQDWVYDPGTNAWTLIQTGAGPAYGETMTVDTNCHCLIAWGASTAGQSLAEIWVGTLSDNTATSPVIISPASLPPGAQNTPYSYAFDATGSPAASWALASGTLPPGLTLSSSGTLSGTPANADTYAFSVTATNTAGVAGPQSFSLVISAPTVPSPLIAPTITTASPLTSATVGTAYSQTFAATGTTPMTWALTSGALPPGMMLSEDGVVSGTPTAEGTYSFSVQAANAAGAATATLTIAAIAPATPGGNALGKTTATCVDVDGDGYGVGGGCQGPDADDTDATVHSTEQALAKWGTLAAFWKHLGYTPANVLYVGGSGNCSKVAQPFSYDATKACATLDAAIAAMGNGDAVVIRGGSYTRSGAGAWIKFKSGSLSGTSCTATAYYLSYPGELPEFVFTDAYGGMSVSGAPQSCYTVDGIKFTQTMLGKGRGFSVAAEMPMYGWTLKHLEISGFNDGIFPMYQLVGMRIENNYIHDLHDNGGLDGHGIYLGSRVMSGSTGSVIRGNVIAHAYDSCLHLNGPMDNVLVDSNLMYGCAKGLAIQSGINHSTFQNNVLHTISSRMVELDVYANQYSTYQWQCHDQNYNVFRNNTFYGTNQSFDLTQNTPSAGSSTIYVVEDKSNGGCALQAGYVPDQGHNTYDSNIIVHDCGPNCVTSATGTPAALNAGSVLRYVGTNAATWFASDTYRNNIVLAADVPSRILDVRTDSSLPANYYDCGWFTNQANAPLVSGTMCNSDPKFMAADPQWSTNPSNYNFMVQSDSPAIGAGYASDAPPYDFAGVPRSAKPTVGAYEYSNGNVVVAPPVETIAGVSCTPASMTGAASSQCTIMLSVAATQATAIALVSDAVSVSVPPSVTVPAGAPAASFTVTIAAVSTLQTAKITASADGSSASATITVAPAPTITLFACTPSTVASGTSTTCSITIAPAAPSGGISVGVVSSSSLVTFPASVTIAAGTTTATFTAAGATVSTSTAVSLTASLGGASALTTLTITPPAATLSGIACKPGIVTGAGGTQCSVTMTSTVAAATTVALADDNVNVTVPASVTIAAGTASAVFTANATAVTADQVATITAHLGTATVNTPVVLRVPASLSAVQCVPTVTTSAATSCSITLTKAAAADAIVNVSSSNTAVQVPAIVTVPAGQTAAAFSAQTSSTAANETATLTVSYAGMSTTAAVTLAASDVRFYMHLRPSEVTGLTNGSIVTPSVTTQSLTGKVVTAGSGSVTWSTTGMGAMFRMGGPQNTNTAMMNFMGTPVASIFSTTGGDVTFSVQSNYNLKERRALPSPNYGWVFDVLSPANRLFSFQIQTSGNRLLFGYQTGGTTAQSYMVPKGQEDVLFGKGITARFRLTWTGTSNSLYLNDTLVSTQQYAPATAWGAASSFTVGATDPRSSGAGAYSCSDTISDFKVVRPASALTAAAVTSLMSDTMESLTAKPSVAPETSGEPAIETIRNAITGSPEAVCARNSIATITGKGLGPANTLFTDPSGRTVEAVGLRVLVNGEFVPILYASTTQVSFACPNTVAAVPLDVRVLTTSGQSHIATIESAEAAVGIAAVNGASGVAQVAPGDELHLRLAGLPSTVNADSVKVTIAGSTAQVSGIEAAPGLFGMTNIAVRVPEIAGTGEVEVRVAVEDSSGGRVSSNSQRIYVKTPSHANPALL